MLKNVVRDYLLALTNECSAKRTLKTTITLWPIVCRVKEFKLNFLPVSITTQFVITRLVKKT